MKRPPKTRRRLDGFAIAFIALVIAGIVLSVPLGPEAATEGRVVAIERGGYRPSDTFARFVLSSGPVARTRIDRDHDCRPGDMIRLKTWPRALGKGYRPRDDPPCQRPLPQQ